MVFYSKKGFLGIINHNMYVRVDLFSRQEENLFVKL